MVKIQCKARWKVKAFNDAQFECRQSYCEFPFNLTFFSLFYLSLICLQHYWCSLGSLALVGYTCPGGFFDVVGSVWVCPKTGGRRAEETCNCMKKLLFFSFMLKPPDGAYCLCTFLGETLHYPSVYGIYQGTAIRLTATCHFIKRWSIGFWKQNTSHNAESFNISTPYDFGCFHELFSQNDALLL